MDDLEDSIKRASALNHKYLGKYTKMERMKNIALLVVGVIFLIVAIVIGMNGDFVGAFFLVLAYLFVVILAFYLVRLFTSKLFRDGQFLLAIFCRAENNRFYLNHGIELRPGFLGQWIEISIIELDEE